MSYFKNSILPSSLAFVVLVSIAGCGNSDRQKVIGTWALDVSDEAGEDLDDRVGGEEPGKMIVRFASDGSLETRTDFGMAKGNHDGTWTLISTSDDKKEFRLSCKLKDYECQTVVTFVDDQTIRMIPPNMAGLEDQIDPMTFKKEESK